MAGYSLQPVLYRGIFSRPLAVTVVFVGNTDELLIEAKRM